MERYCQQLNDLWHKLGRPHIFYTGDIFHTTREPAELVNFLINSLPRGYAIPGQHDLPYHRYEDITKSPYWTLVEASRISHLEETTWLNGNGKRPDLYVTPFSWGREITECHIKDRENMLAVALVHAYCWIGGCSYAGAPEDKHVGEYAKKLKGYDAAFFGDNHKVFLTERESEPQIMNCGCFIPQKSDERCLPGCVGILYSNGIIKPHYLDNTDDKWVDGVDEVLEGVLDTHEAEMGQFLEELKSITSTSLSFVDTVKHIINDKKVGEGVRTLILKAMEDK